MNVTLAVQLRGHRGQVLYQSKRALTTAHRTVRRRCVGRVDNFSLDVVNLA